MNKQFLAGTVLSCLLGMGLVAAGVSAADEVPKNMDLAIVSNTANVRHAKVGQVVTFTIVATDYGPDLPGELFVQAHQASDSLQLGPVICEPFGQCAPVICEFALSLPGPSADHTQCEFGIEGHLGEPVTATIAFAIQGTGSKYASDTACVSASDYPPPLDPNPANDCATATVKIVGKRR
jgi:hypothetical protein